MRTSSSRPVQFIGEGPLPEFDFSQEPLPDSIRVLLWMLDGAERRHRLARKWQSQVGHDLHVEVKGSEIIVTLPGTSYAVNYYMLANSPQLHGKHLPAKSIDGLRSRRRRSSEKPGSSPTTRRAS